MDREDDGGCVATLLSVFVVSVLAVLFFSLFSYVLNLQRRVGQLEVEVQQLKQK